MIYFEKISLLFTNPKEFLIRLNKYLSWIFLDKIFFFFIFFIFTFFPSSICFFISNIIIKKADRWKKDNPENDWIFGEQPSIIFDEINIICRGSSLKKNADKINKKNLTFFVNFDKKSFDYLPALKDIPYIGITADTGVEKRILQSGLAPVINLIGGYKFKEIVKWDREDTPLEKNYTLNNIEFNKINLLKSKKITHFKESNQYERFYIGSAVLAIFFLGKHSKKINIFGWDHYLNRSADKLNYFQALYSMAFRDPSGPWEKRFRCVFIESIWNWHYASRIANDNKYKIFSNLTNVSSQNKILKKINTIFFN